MRADVGGISNLCCVAPRVSDIDGTARNSLGFCVGLALGQQTSEIKKITPSKSFNVVETVLLCALSTLSADTWLPTPLVWNSTHGVIPILIKSSPLLRFNDSGGDAQSAWPRACDFVGIFSALWTLWKLHSRKLGHRGNSVASLATKLFLTF
jgi:hypothetical protein